MRDNIFVRRGRSPGEGFKLPETISRWHVVPSHETPGPTLTVEPGHLVPATAFAVDIGIGGPRNAQINSGPVLGVMGLHGLQHLKIFRSIVEFVLVDMVYYFAPAKWSSKRLGRHETVLVDISPRIRHGVSWDSQHPVSASGHDATASPVRVLASSSVAHRVNASPRDRQSGRSVIAAPVSREPRV